LESFIVSTDLLLLKNLLARHGGTYLECQHSRGRDRRIENLRVAWPAQQDPVSKNQGLGM
jgi:hypothetical protein